MRNEMKPGDVVTFYQWSGPPVPVLLRQRLCDDRWRVVRLSDARAMVVHSGLLEW